MKEFQRSIEEVQAKVAAVVGILNLPQQEQHVLELEEQSQSPTFWSDEQKARQVMQEIAQRREQITFWRTLEKDLAELHELLVLTQDDEAAHKELEERFATLQQSFTAHEFEVLFSEKYDHNDALLAIHAGTGGVDAQDWAEILLRMYMRCAEQKGFSVKMIDTSRGEEAGIKTAILEITGANAFGTLCSESGVHRLVRQSPFSADQLRHTSFALVEVLPVIGESGEVQINPTDLKIDTFRASGAGGQYVNKTDSAVRITHVPSGIVVASQTERSQQQNKAQAMKILLAKLHQRHELEREQEKQKIRGAYSEAAWGNQIRSYVLHPYKLVKDHRTNYEEHNAQAVLDGQLQGFIESYLRYRAAQKHQ